MGKKAFDIKTLHGRWVHSREEDTERELVFRPPEYDFPPSRSRASFQLNSDNSYIGAGIGPTDISQVKEGRWQLQPGTSARLHIEYDDHQADVEITSASPERLTIRRKQTHEE